ncbi:MAG: zinc-binding alcohol dehydrogenase [Armatimonadetes bacterium]|nr:zinc-binding alcohol dehydrogenase [Armatimonadota bacterium]
MQGCRLVFTGLGRVELEPFGIDPPGPGQVLYRTLVTQLSAGTETAKFVGLQQVEFPWVPGYAAVGEVLECGPGVTSPQVGERVYTYGPHASLGVTQVLHARVPDGLAAEAAVFARLGTVALTALRVSDVELGDRVAVLGLGVVGNLAAQLFQLAGCEVFGLETDAFRRERAAACGVRHVVDATVEGGVPEVKALTCGRGCECVVEAVGRPQLVETACALAAPRGEVVWVGSPRGEWVTDVTPILNQVHLWGNGCLTFKGAHEWRIPVRPSDGLKHSLESHAELLLRLLAEGRLATEPLRTHLAEPAAAQGLYEALRDRKPGHLGVLFDWRGMA